MKLVPLDRRKATFAVRLALAFLATALVPLLLYAAAPVWWSNRAVLTENTASNDYAPANHGQLKNIAKAAVAEMDAKLPGGAGAILHELIGKWSAVPESNDFAPINVGQLKEVAKPFYDRLIAAGLRSQYPWTNASSQPDDFGIANIGQVKNLFGFELPALDPLYDGDHNGLPDQWEQQYFGATGVDPNADPDGDGIGNLQEYVNGTDPTDFFNGTLTSLSVTRGGDQRGLPGAFLPVPVSVRVSSLYSYGVPNAPVTFVIAQGSARLIPDQRGASAPSAELTVRANAYDNEGSPVAQVYVLLPPTPDVSVIRASARGGARLVSATAVAVAIDPTLVAPSNLVVTATSASSARLTWTVANSAAATTLQVSVDGGKTWMTLGAVAPGVTEANVTGLTPNSVAKFRLISGGMTGLDTTSFALPDASNNSPPAPPPGPGPGGGPASESVDVKPLGAPVLEIETASVYRGKFGFPGLLNHTGPYRDETIVITSDYVYGNGMHDPFTGSTTVRQHWQRSEDGGHVYQTDTREVIGGGGYLNSPWTTVTSTDTFLRQEGAPFDGSTGGSSRTISLSGLYTDAELAAEGAALQPFFYNEFWPARNDAYAHLWTRGGYQIGFLQYRFTVNADPNLVVTWDVEFTPGDGTEVQHDIQSWSSDGSLQSPTYMLDPRTLNGGKDGTYRIVQLSTEVMVDGNRDGEMSFDDSTVREKDRTSSNRPYRFWVNDDQDNVGIGTVPTTYGDGETVPPSNPNYNDPNIRTVRDLEDWSRLWISFDGITDLVKSSDIAVELVFEASEGQPAIKVCRAVESDGGRQYLADISTAAAQIADDFGVVHGPISSAMAFNLKNIGLNNLDSRSYLLFEGVAEGKGKLELRIKKAGQTIGKSPALYLEIKNVKKMYERVKAQPDDIVAPYMASTAFSGPVNYVSDPNGHPFERTWDETHNCVIFVHGWNVSYDEYNGVAETMFKRLWQKGFKGHFASFRWDTRKSDNMFDPGEYNRSENRAFVYGASLKGWVESLSANYAVSIVGHSMGNVVCAEALRQGMLVRNYVLMEAAIPMSCYDANAQQLARLVNKDAQYPTPDHHIDPLTNERTFGYRGYLGSVSGTFTNCYNRDDWALSTGFTIGLETNWEKNQIDYKPDGSGGGIHNPLWNYHYDFTKPLALRATLLSTFSRYVGDSWEIKAFIARSRTKAVGAFPEGNPAFTQNINLSNPPFNFGRERSDHSGQFTRDIQNVDVLYNAMRNALEE